MSKHNELAWVRFTVNMGRIAGLMRLVFPDPAPTGDTAFFRTDALRADLFRSIVVFLHAALEDLLRSAARLRVAEASPEVLDRIPLVGTSREPKKFFLGALHRHRGKTVDQLVQESVEEYMSTRSVSTTDDLEGTLKEMSVDSAAFRPLYPDLADLMRRRHRIVHEADLSSPVDREAASWTYADDMDVGIWNLAVIAFEAVLSVSLYPEEDLDRLVLAKRMSALELGRKVRAELKALGPLSAEALRTSPALRAGLESVAASLQEVTALLPLSDDEILAVWKKRKSPDDETTEEEARAQIAGWRLTGRR